MRAQLEREDRDSRAWALAFSAACEQGDVEEFLAIVSRSIEVVDGWRLAFRKVARLRRISPKIRAAFVNVWVESKHLPLSIGDRRTAADGLRVLFPGGYRGAPIRLFRGAGGRERRHQLYGFSWTTRLDVARTFAEKWRPSVHGGVVLETSAPASSVLLVRKEADYYDEGEVVVDPFRLGPIGVVERLAPPSPAPPDEV